MKFMGNHYLACLNFLMGICDQLSQVFNCILWQKNKCVIWNVEVFFVTYIQVFSHSILTRKIYYIEPLKHYKMATFSTQTLKQFLEREREWKNLIVFVTILINRHFDIRFNYTVNQKIMQRREDEAERRNRIFQQINRYFMLYDCLLTVLSLILTLSLITQACYPLMFLLYTIIYCFQVLQHYLILKFPKIDINKHHVLYRRVIILIGFVDVGYLFINVMFWSKNDSHPIYCVLCEQLGIGMWVGLFFVIHFFVITAWFFALINSYIQRRYYLLALGGYENEQNILEERERRMRQMMIREPNYDVIKENSSKIDKYFKFEDVIEEQMEGDIQCSICLNEGENNNDKFVNAGCGHLYHEVCLRNWVNVNSNCPQCRKPIRESFKQRDISRQNNEQQAPEQNDIDIN